MEIETVYYREFDVAQMISLVACKLSIEVELFTGERGAAMLDKNGVLNMPDLYKTCVLPSFDDRVLNRHHHKDGGLTSSYCFVFSICGIPKVKYYPIECKPKQELTEDDNVYLDKTYNQTK